jgi:hypothetical protein
LVEPKVNTRLNVSHRRRSGKLTFTVHKTFARGGFKRRMEEAPIAFFFVIPGVGELQRFLPRIFCNPFPNIDSPHRPSAQCWVVASALTKHLHNAFSMCSKRVDLSGAKGGGKISVAQPHRCDQRTRQAAFEGTLCKRSNALRFNIAVEAFMVCNKMFIV